MERYYAKKFLRTQLKVNRSEISIKQSQCYQQSLQQFLSSTTLCGSYVVCYSPLHGEVDITGLAATFRCGLTRVAPHRQLTVHNYDSASEMSPYGFRQPVAEAPRLDDTDIGAVLLPGLAFDLRGARLGYGQGYFDRFLARLDKKVLKIGIVTTLVDAVPEETHDIAMTHLGFENEVIACVA